MYSMNRKTQTLIIAVLLLLLFSIGLFSIRFLYDDVNDSLDADLSSDNQMSKSINDQDISFISEYLNIKIDLTD